MRWLALAFLLAACGPTPGVCSWHRCLPTERSVWIHVPGHEWHRAYAATRRAWDEAGLPEPDVQRVSATPHPLADQRLAGFVSTSTRARSGIVVSTDIDAEAQERVVVHELVHVFGGRSGLDLDRGHADPRRWRPHPESVEARATCALQPEHCP